MENFEEIAHYTVPPISFILIVIYHVIIGIIGLIRPRTIHVTLNIKSSFNWIMEMMFVEGREMICLQTIRNFIYGTSILAALSSSLALFVGTHGFDIDPIFLEYKIQMYCLSIILFISFSFFALSVRFVFHLQFLILAKDMTFVKRAIEEILESKDGEEDIFITIPETEFDLNLQRIKKLDILRMKNLEKAKRTITLVSLFFTIGVRGLLIGIPIIVWAFLGVWAMLGSSFCLILFFIFLDGL
jgi:hypothetical protein